MKLKVIAKFRDKFKKKKIYQVDDEISIKDIKRCKDLIDRNLCISLEAPEDKPEAPEDKPEAPEDKPEAPEE